MKIQSKIKDYQVELIDDVLSKRDAVFSNLKYDNLFYFVDGNVSRIYKDKLSSFIDKDFHYVIKALETNKKFDKLSDFYKILIDEGFTRNDVLVTIGGGILQDISGFIASTLYRGVKWVFLPTTLLSQADSCIGSKTSINFKDSKNLIGSFYPPNKIFIDVSFCDTLTPEYFNSGLGEIIKFHFLSDAKKYDLLKEYLSSQDLRKDDLFKEIIWSTLKIKKSYFEQDEFDTGKRNLLNYGHCFGHALESASNFEICHGEAVIVGMGFANLLSLKRGVLKKGKYLEFEEILKRYYPKFDISKIKVDDILYYLKHDKKRVGKNLTMILAGDIGKHYKNNDIKKEEIVDTFGEFVQYYKKIV